MLSARRVIGWLLIAFVIFYVLSAPQSSADLVRAAVGGLGDAADSLSQFVSSLA